MPVSKLDHLLDGQVIVDFASTSSDIEDDPKNGYCYPTVFDGGDYLLVGYYHSNGSGVPLNSNKIVKVLKSELAD